MDYDFDWDTDKASQNRRKHRVRFELAATVFVDPRALSLYDAMHSKNEDRWITLGMAANGGLLVVCHTFEPKEPGRACIRIISCRKATKRELCEYSKGAER